ncbi:MAG: LPS export ABC transporter periplasmic protein LptC [Nitrospirae bacterium]|nr:LPS export ABC transporter periplasmic protein LptC [Nitrospirota bacterium]
MIRKILLILLIPLAGGTFFILNYNEDDVKTRISYRMSSMKGFNLTHKDGGKVKWELTAKSATFPQGDKEVLLKDLNIKVHQVSDITLTGGDGNYNIERKVLAVNNAIRITINSSILTTDSLTWHGDKEIITTGDRVKFTGKKFLIEGRGLAVDVREQQVKVLENVKGIFYN